MLFFSHNYISDTKMVQVASKTGYNFDTSQHAVYSLQYHLIVCTKYRRVVFDNPDLVDFLKRKIHDLKGSTSKSIRHQFPQVKDKLGEDAFWSKSYCLTTTGEVTLDKLKEYVDSQGDES